MKILIPILTVVLVICGCSKQKADITTPENANLILLCSSVLQTNDQVQIVHRVDEVIKGSIEPELLDESKLIKGFSFPTIEDMNIPQNYFIFARPKVNAPDINSFRVKYQATGIPVYDETILEHKHDIHFLQAEFDRQMNLHGEINIPSEKEIRRLMDEHEKQAGPVN